MEYEDTRRDLLGVRSELQELLPGDGKAFGFDNVGEALDLGGAFAALHGRGGHGAEGCHESGPRA